LTELQIVRWEEKQDELKEGKVRDGTAVAADQSLALKVPLATASGAREPRRPERAVPWATEADAAAAGAEEDGAGGVSKAAAAVGAAIETKLEWPDAQEVEGD
jgi:hypothetical protein